MTATPTNTALPQPIPQVVEEVAQEVQPEPEVTPFPTQLAVELLATATNTPAAVQIPTAVVVVVTATAINTPTPVPVTDVQTPAPPTQTLTPRPVPPTPTVTRQDAPTSISKPQDVPAPTAVLTAPSTVQIGERFKLSGARSVAVSPSEIVRYRWTALEGGFGPVETKESTVEVTSDTRNPLPAGLHTFSLVVVDNFGNQSAPALASVIVQQAKSPTAVLTVPGTVQIGESFTLSGERSIAVPSNKIVEYRWLAPGGGFGPVVTIQPSVEVAIDPLNPLPIGAHTFSLVVVDNLGNQSTPDAASVIVQQTRAPTAVLTTPLTIQIGESFVLSGKASTAVSPSKIARYRWTRIEGGAPFETEEATVMIRVNPDRPLPLGMHTYSLVVVDDSGNESLPALAGITVRQTQAPTAVLTVPRNVTSGESFKLSGDLSSAAPQSRIVKYIWAAVDGGFGPIETDLPNAEVNVNPKSPLPPGKYVYSLVVVDDSGNESLPALASVIILEE